MTDGIIINDQSVGVRNYNKCFEKYSSFLLTVS